ncbi:hypothetical protein BJ875DRAFT_462283 [Amylocarpus encephaloides]|uniref:Actin-related protein RO7 n=1 Tax=Amylocarpus encephaloides TaxID=45428 RepID=A0A9P8C5G6_9HELO|nr:hypothetical protein BJ875DRAFT_462283 [Amylocarpus encephaloides]
MSATTGPSHRNVVSIRSPPSTNTGVLTSPHTPLRGISSAFGSPSALRAEEDNVIIELGSRYLRAGFAGDSLPKAVVDFGPEAQRRAGDYRRWNVGYSKEWRKRTRGNDWGERHELWEPDLRNVDLGLVGDKIDRAMRDAFANHLLIDSRPRRFTLILPSALPLPLLSTILDTLFTNFQPPTISLLSSSALSTISAGLRSALVVDIGWRETVVSTIYEYREVQCTRSTRATKLLGEEMLKVLGQLVSPRSAQDLQGPEATAAFRDLVSFEECEDVVTRVAWCKPSERAQKNAPSQGLTPVKEEDEFRSSMRSLKIWGGTEVEAHVSLPIKSTKAPKTLQIPFSKLAEPCETALFATGVSESDLDDEETPLHLLIYRGLMKLPTDVRSICMARIVFVGGGAKLPGLKARVLDELATLVGKRGWDPVQGKAMEVFRENSNSRKTRIRNSEGGPLKISPDQRTPASLQEIDPDPIEEGLRREARKHNPPVEAGNLRAIDSLGAWSGGSLLSHLKVPAVSVIDREQWLQHGALGASKTVEVSVSSRQSMGPGAFKAGAGERSSWTLGLWG